MGHNSIGHTYTGTGTDLLRRLSSSPAIDSRRSTVSTAYIVMALYSYGPIELWPYIVMAYVAMAYIVMAIDSRRSTVSTAYIVIALYRYGPI